MKLGDLVSGHGGIPFYEGVVHVCVHEEPAWISSLDGGHSFRAYEGGWDVVGRAAKDVMDGVLYVWRGGDTAGT